MGKARDIAFQEIEEEVAAMGVNAIVRIDSDN